MSTHMSNFSISGGSQPISQPDLTPEPDELHPQPQIPQPRAQQYQQHQVRSCHHIYNHTISSCYHKPTLRTTSCIRYHHVIQSYYHHVIIFQPRAQQYQQHQVLINMSLYLLSSYDSVIPLFKVMSCNCVIIVNISQPRAQQYQQYHTCYNQMRYHLVI